MQRIIGIIGAMPEETDGIVALMSDAEQHSFGRRTYHCGHINDTRVVVVFSRWGKVAAAATVATLIHEFHITELIFTGVAGAIDAALNIGDIVIGKSLIQHDMDARPLMERYEIPLLGQTWFESTDSMISIAVEAVTTLINAKALHHVIDDDDLREFGIVSPKLAIGNIASGDKFFASDSDRHELQDRLPSILCVEMEGAAVAQVCYEYNIPFVILRTISDAANDKAHFDFPAFVRKIASKYSAEIVRGYVANL